ncbi:hypothetical protein IFM89_007988 [Coptis chinensis]|uniref:ACB domain-containing protein n=1 Tax=Coptis chinensis TaxID=261450 RepID=A0A835INX2_9MAGN|nr:hypothetical protein IFM89_007988 [Coptis chinensis]
MELLMELFFTASLSLVLAFLFAKLVSMSSVGENEHKEEITKEDNRLMNQGLESVDKQVEESDKIVDDDEEEEELVYESGDVPLIEVGYIKKVKKNRLKEVKQIHEKEKDCDVSVKDEVIEHEVNKRWEYEENEEMFSEDDDWEGIEKSDVAKLFGAASRFVNCSDNVEELSKLGNDVLMKLYGLHKVAMEGPCRESPPLALKVSARTKWNAWQRLGNMTPEVAMEEYVNLLSGGIPGWMGENPEGTHEDDKSNVDPDAGGSRIEDHESLSIRHLSSFQNERKPGFQSLGEGSDANSL